MFCWAVRYSLPESTLFLAGQYGNACRRVRYFLLGGTIMLVGEYAIPFRVPTDPKISAFAGLSSTVASKRVGWPQEEERICRPALQFLSESTVSICWTVRYSGGDGCFLLASWSGCLSWKRPQWPPKPPGRSRRSRRGQSPGPMPQALIRHRPPTRERTATRYPDWAGVAHTTICRLLRFVGP